MNDLKMKDLSLLQMLRYFFAGTVLLIFVYVSYQEPRNFVTSQQDHAALVAALFAVSLTVGSILYTLHRAVPYPLLYWIFAKINKRDGSMLDMDIKRWRHLSQPGSLQSRIGEWAAQVHFLYCLSWAGFAGLSTGQLTGWTETETSRFLLPLSFVFLGAALLHHFRYQRWEKQIFAEDNGAATA
jgi:hypothetical protein